MKTTEFDGTQEMRIVDLGDALFILIRGEDAKGVQLTGTPGLMEIWAGEHGDWRKCEHISRPGLDTVFIANIFSRTDSKIRLRWKREGQAFNEFSVANPKPTPVKTWEVEPLPAIKPFSEGTVRLIARPWKRNETTGHWGVRLRAIHEENPKWFNVELESITDATGNYINYDDPTNPLPPGNGAWKAKYAIRRSGNYPAKFKDCVVIGQGTFEDPAQPPTIVPSAQLKALGNVVLTAAHIGPNSRGDGDVFFEFKCAVRGSRPLDLFGDFHSLTVPWKIFVDEELIPAKQDWTSSPGSGRTDDTFYGEWSYKWLGSLKPGTKFQVAVPLVVPPEIVEFTFDPPTFTGGN